MQRYYSSHIVPEVLSAGTLTLVVGMRYFHAAEHSTYRTVDHSLLLSRLKS